MFIMTNTTPTGNYTPSKFATKKEAQLYLKGLAFLNAYEGYAEDFTTELLDFIAKLSTVKNAIDNNLKKSVVNFEVEDAETYDKFYDWINKFGYYDQLRNEIEAHPIPDFVTKNKVGIYKEYLTFVVAYDRYQEELANEYNNFKTRLAAMKVFFDTELDKPVIDYEIEDWEIYDMFWDWLEENTNCTISDDKAYIEYGDDTYNDLEIHELT